MKGYSSEIGENCAIARVEGVNASYKDLAEVCGVIRNKKSGWALSFLEKAAAGDVPVLYRRHNKKTGHRRELGGKKGRYPEKAAGLVLKVLKSAMANGKVIGLGDNFVIVGACANKKGVYPRMAPKGRTSRSCLVTARVEIVLKGEAVPKGVTITPPKKEEKKTVAKKEEKTAEEKMNEHPQILKEEGKVEHEHKHVHEKELEQEKKHPEGIPHQHGEHDNR